MKININDKQPEIKALNELTEGEVFKLTGRYYIKTNIIDYNHSNKIVCIDLQTGESKQIYPNEPIIPVDTELNIYE